MRLLKWTYTTSLAFLIGLSALCSTPAIGESEDAGTGGAQATAESTRAEGCPGRCRERCRLRGGDKTEQTCPSKPTERTAADARPDAQVPHPDQPNPPKGTGTGEAVDDHPTGPPQHARTIHALLTDHTKITRSVTDIPNGIESTTTSDDPQVAALIQKHLAEVSERLKNGQPMRRWDPLFAEIFKHHDKITLEITNIDNGVRVRETSDDPMVVKLIRQHAHKGVGEFVRDGFARAQQSSPLPEGYVSPQQDELAPGPGMVMGQGRGRGMGMGDGRGMGRGAGWGRQKQDPSSTDKTDTSEP